MHDLDQGHKLLKAGKYQEAYDYFTQMATDYKDAKKTLYGCIYGQARALAKLKRPEEAKELLSFLMENVPKWEAPYISLARIFEGEILTLKELGDLNAASQRIEKVDNTYLLAINQTDRSERLTRHYEYFLKENFAALRNQKTFTPVLNGSVVSEKQKTFTPGFSHLNRKAAPPIAPATSPIAPATSPIPLKQR